MKVQKTKVIALEGDSYARVCQNLEDIINADRNYELAFGTGITVFSAGNYFYGYATLTLADDVDDDPSDIPNIF